MDFTEQNKPLFESLMGLIRSTSSLNAQDIDFVRSLNRDFGKRSANASKKLLTLINKLILSSTSQTSSLDQPFSSADDLVTRWRSVEQSLDLLMDKIDAPPQGQMQQLQVQQQNQAQQDQQQVKEYMKLANNISKPQLQFNTKVDNSVGPFKPHLTQKPHATYTPLSQSLELQAPDADHEREWYQQPYLQEIQHSEYPDTGAAQNNDGIPDWESTPLTYVDTPEQLFKMVSKLERTTEIAIDVEHHDYRTYLGLVCLVQITGGGEDYIVDALKLRSELQVLNKVFANPRIVKVLHGAKMDIMWLQRDLGVYIVNLFDTYFAARELLFPKLSLAYLLQHYVDFEAQKKYQLADWRLRPLPIELIDYARADTHFLLYIYHQLYAKLVENGKLDVVLAESRKVASQRFENPGWNEVEPEWVNFAIKYRIHGEIGRAVLVKLYEWRDQMARKNDESPRFVMSPSMLANLCVTKPNNGAGVLSASHKVSNIVRNNAEEIARVVQNACKNASKIDTTIPDRVRTGTPAVSAAAVPATTSSSSAEELRADSDFMVNPPEPDATSVHPKVDLSVVLPQDLHQAQVFNEQAAERQAEQERAEKEELERQSEQKRAEDEALKRKLLSQSEANNASGKGKKINVVGDSEDFELSSKINSAKRTKKLVDEPAFDFASASNVMNIRDDPVDSRSFRRTGSGNEPKGVRKNTSRSKKARSFR